MEKKNRLIVFLALYLALAVVFDLIKEFLPFLNMPFGGSVNIALIPVVLCSFHLGYKYGLLCGFLWFVITTILGLNSWIISFGQVLFDYILLSTVVGLSSLFYRHHKLWEMELGILMSMFLRIISIVISGAIYWPGDAASGSLAAWVASLAYNVPYSLATLVLLLVLMPIISRRLRDYLL